MVAAALGYPIQQNPFQNFILPYYMAKKINWQPNFNWNLPNINFQSPFDAANKAFAQETLVPAYLANRYDNTGMEAMNWYYYMKKHHPTDLLAINRLLPTAMLTARQSQNRQAAPEPYVAPEPVNLIPDGYEGQSFRDVESWADQDDFWKGSNGGFPGK